MIVRFIGYSKSSFLGGGYSPKSKMLEMFVSIHHVKSMIDANNVGIILVAPFLYILQSTAAMNVI